MNEDVDLWRHRSARALIGLMALLGLYGFADGLQIGYGYAGTLPLHWFLLVFLLTCIIGIFVAKALPLSPRLGLAALISALACVAAIPGLLRLNMIGPVAFVPRAYEATDIGHFVPVDRDLPRLQFSGNPDFWSTFQKGSQRNFLLARGQLGFYQYDLEAVRTEMRAFYERAATSP